MNFMYRFLLQIFIVFKYYFCICLFIKNCEFIVFIIFYSNCPNTLYNMSLLPKSIFIILVFLKIILCGLNSVFSKMLKKFN